MQAELASVAGARDDERAMFTEDENYKNKDAQEDSDRNGTPHPQPQTIGGLGILVEEEGGRSFERGWLRGSLTAASGSHFAVGRMAENNQSTTRRADAIESAAGLCRVGTFSAIRLTQWPDLTGTAIKGP